jgi:hypothetical protein
VNTRPVASSENSRTLRPSCISFRLTSPPTPPPIFLSPPPLPLAARSYGYDPLGLGKDKETVEKYRANELIHARWAMLAAAGIIIPEGLQVRDWEQVCAGSYVLGHMCVDAG